MKPSLYTVYCIGQAGHGRGKDDSCGSTMAIYINYLSMLEAQKYLSVKGGGGDWRGGEGGGERELEKERKGRLLAQSGSVGGR